MQEYYIGSNLNTWLSGLLQRLNVATVFLVRGKDSYVSCGASNIIGEILVDGKMQTIHFSDFSINPKIEDVNKGVSLCMAEFPEIILAVGGGSTIDTAKLIRYYVLQETGKYIPLIAVPTTAGSGAEATHFSVCYINEEKHSIEDSTILPDYAFIYPEFTYHNDAYLTACTGFDAVAQAMESYWSVKSTDESRDYSLKALNLLWKQLPLLMGDLKNESLRRQVAEGAYYAGRAINITTTTAPHAFSYKFTSLYSYAHGDAVALTFPFFFALNTLSEELQSSLNEEEYKERMNLLLRVLECKCTGKKSRQLYMEGYISSLGLLVRKFTLSEIALVLNSFNMQRAKNNPVVIDRGIVEELGCYLA